MKIRKLPIVLLLCTMFFFVSSALSSNTASVRIVFSVEPIAAVAVTQDGVSTGNNKSYVTVRDGIKTIRGNGLVWTVNYPGVRISARSDGGLENLTVSPTNIKGGSGKGTILLRGADQDLITDLDIGIGHCDLEYQVPASSDGVATVIYTITSQ